jgi:glycosyltransferase involved in cell wall biosynthesis
MRIGIFTDNDFGKVNGVTTTLTAVLTSAPVDLEPRIYTCSDLAIDQPEYLALRSIGVTMPFYRTMRMYWPRFRRLLHHARSDGLDLVHLTTPGPVGLAAMYVAAKLGLPMIGSFHTDLAAYTQLLSGSTRLAAWMALYMRWMYGRCARVLVPSDSTRQLLLSAGAKPESITIWPRGVDTSLFTPARRSHALRNQWGVSERRPAVLYVGRVSREKGLSLLPSLGAALRGLGIAHRLIVAGDGPMLSELQEQCPDAVFTGALSRTAVAETFASADIFLFPSRTDTAGNVVLEAQAAGLPVLVAGAGGPRENMVPDHTGRVMLEDTAAWTAAAAMLLTDATMRDRMSRAARQYALTRRWSSALEPLYHAYRAEARPRGASGLRSAMTIDLTQAAP